MDHPAFATLMKKHPEHVEAAESRINQEADLLANSLLRSEGQLVQSAITRGLLQSSATVGEVLNVRREKAETLYKKMLAEYLPLFFEYAEEDISKFKEFCITTTKLDVTRLPEMVGLEQVRDQVAQAHSRRFEIWVECEFNHAFKQMRSDVKKSAEKNWREIRWEVFVTIVLGSMLGGVFGALSTWGFEKLTGNASPPTTSKGTVR